ncbi:MULTISPECIES: nitrite reductase small subunit NirD [Micrococcaceae]|uniref:nitrite reductase small subunit NirD n=1 Tax=Micrococcaceae TaxID=1268 RepID=UPI0010364F00|nr:MULTISPECIES: nitrite reductase small subunit NirD [Micrococcaceae]TAP28383.1 nitrite reductase small subunit NirD [Arthrobacter sp. S41]UXN32817.1 nitrite reductase small subunit NirD [Glutamicibacter sp. M10]
MSTQFAEETLEKSVSFAPVCRSEELEAGWGEALLLDGAQLALFRTESNSFYAASHHCPTTGAKVMARGILGGTMVDGQSVATVACPLHKEVYRLDTGSCLNADSPALQMHELVEVAGQLWLEKTK